MTVDVPGGLDASPQNSRRYGLACPITLPFRLMYCVQKRACGGPYPYRYL